MKKVIAFLCLLTVTLFFVGCKSDKYIPTGYIKSEEHFDTEGFQDYTDFCIYTYDENPFDHHHSEYRKITEDDIDKIKGYFTDFKQWIEEQDRLDEYSFDDTCISTEDYCFILTKEGQPIGNSSYGVYDHYSVYFFDTDTLTLYYIHNNI